MIHLSDQQAEAIRGGMTFIVSAPVTTSVAVVQQANIAAPVVVGIGTKPGKPSITQVSGAIVNQKPYLSALSI
ncbi:MAG: hypothetical protein ACKOXO_02675 [Cyanobium sp.]